MGTWVRWRLLLAIHRSRDDGGQAMVEYALLLSLIATVSFAILEIFGVRLSGLYSSIVDQIPTP